MPPVVLLDYSPVTLPRCVELLFAQAGLERIRGDTRSQSLIAPVPSAKATMVARTGIVSAQEEQDKWLHGTQGRGSNDSCFFV